RATASDCADAASDASLAGSAADSGDGMTGMLPIVFGNRSSKAGSMATSGDAATAPDVPGDAFETGEEVPAGAGDGIAEGVGVAGSQPIAATARTTARTVAAAGRRELGRRI